MRLVIRSQGFEVGPQLRESIERRLRFVLGRFGGQIGAVIVNLAEPPSPEQTEAKRCRIDVRLIRSYKCRVEETGTNLVDVVEQATHRVGQVVGRSMNHL